MNALTVFEDRRNDFLTQLEAAQGPQARAQTAVFIVEQIACVLAQEETDGAARQRQQAVLALCKASPSLLSAAKADGELVIAPAAKHAPSACQTHSRAASRAEPGGVREPQPARVRAS